MLGEIRKNPRHPRNLLSLTLRDKILAKANSTINIK